MRSTWNLRQHKGKYMSLSFPNASRSYDPTRQAVRFWGYDSAMERSFFVTDDALRRVQPDMQASEPGKLDAFDANRELICATARKIYMLGPKGSYELVADDFDAAKKSSADEGTPW
jgi:hypothetical protein